MPPKNEAHGSAIFLDTSVIIARFFHGKPRRLRIEARLKGYDITITSSVVRTEFRRRILAEAAYVLRILRQTGSFNATLRYVQEKLGHWGHSRKRNICIEMLLTLLENTTDAERTERSRRYLRRLILHGVEDFERSVGHILGGCSCFCGIQPVVERKPYERYSFGTDYCSEVKGNCGILAFLNEKAETLPRLLRHIGGLPDAEKGVEIRRAEDFLKRIIEHPETAPDEEPCLMVGDLLIALESADIPDFYTLDKKESSVLCQVLQQKLILRPSSDDQADQINDWSQGRPGNPTKIA